MSIILEKLNNFKKSAEELNEAWNQKFDFSNNYPFPKCFEETVSDIQEWTNSCKLELLANKQGYCVCKETCEYEEVEFTEDWWYTFNVNIDTGFIEIREEGSHGFDIVDLYTFEKYFFKVPEDLYRAYILLSGEGEGYEELTKTARILYDK